MKNGVKILAALALLFALILLFWWDDKKLQEKEAQEEAENKVIQVDPENIDRLVLTNEKGSIEFVRREKKDDLYTDAFAKLSEEFTLVSDWKITRPYSALAEIEAVDTLFENLDEAQIQKKIGGDEAQMAQYGLNPAQAKLEFFKGNEMVASVRLGEENTAGDQLYVTSTKLDGAGLSDFALKYLISKAPNTWRDLRVLGVANKSDLQSIEVKRKGQAYLSLEQNKAANWMITAPKTLPAGDAASALLSKLSTLKADQVVAENQQSLSSFSLQPPGFEIRLNPQGSESDSATKDSQVLYVSKVAKGEESKIYAYRKNQPYVYQIPQALWEQLEKDWKTYIDRHVFGENIGEMQQITWQKGEQSVSVAETEGAWHLEGKPEKSYDQAFRISSLMADAFVSKGKPNLAGDVYAKLSVTFETPAEKSDGKAEEKSDEKNQIEQKQTKQETKKTDKQRQTVTLYTTQTKRGEDEFYLGHVSRTDLYFEFNKQQIDEIETGFMNLLKDEETTPDEAEDSAETESTGQAAQEAQELSDVLKQAHEGHGHE